MHRLLVLGCVLSLGCAAGSSGPDTGRAPAGLAAGTLATVPVGSGPPDCGPLHLQIERTVSEVRPDAHTWLDAPVRMAEARRLRALEARATALGCELPRG